MSISYNQTNTEACTHIPALFIAASEDYRDKTFFRYFESSWQSITYGEFFSLAEHIALFLLSSGIKEKERIAIVAENSPQWAASYLAIVMCRAIAVPIDMQLGVDELRNLLRDAEAKIVFYSTRTDDTIKKATEGSATEAVNLMQNWDGVEKVEERCGALLRERTASISPNDVASLIYTSGTTGKPKGVVLSHHNLCADAHAVIQAHILERDDRMLALLPLHHTYPFMCTFLAPALLGVEVTFAPSLKAADLIAAIKEKEITIVIGVPRLLEMIRDGIFAKIKAAGALSSLIFFLTNVSGRIRRMFGVNSGKVLFRSVHKNFGALKFFASGGARLDPQIMKDLESLGFTVVEGYGLTETSPVITFNPLKRRKPGSAGKPLPGVDLRISPEGEIMVKGPMVMQGYYHNPEATQEVFKEGWLSTGDLGSLDEEGYLFTTGRKKEVIVLSSGKNIYPEDVEKVYADIPLIKEIAIIETKNERSVSALHAAIVPDLEYAKQHQIGNIREALKWKINSVSMTLPEYMRVKGFTLVSEPLPRTPLGKLKRYMIGEVLRNAEKGAVQRKEEERPHDPLAAKVVEMVHELVHEDSPVHLSDNLELDLGFDSLKRIELVSSLEHAFSTNLPETFISEVQTVEDIVSHMRAHMLQGSGEGHVSIGEFLEKDPAPDEKKKIGLSHNLLERILIVIAFVVLKLLFKTVFRLQVEGKGHLPQKGPFIIAPNHTSYIDGFIVALSTSLKVYQDLYFLGFQKYFSGRVLSRIAKLAHTIPVDTETYLQNALQLVAYGLRQEKIMCIFPEGGRSFDGTLMEFKKGIGVLAMELNIPVVPAHITGAYETLPRGSFFPRPRKLIIRYGHPVLSSEIQGEEGADKYHVFAEHLRERVRALASLERFAK